jgi:hypothetical protein
VAGLCGGTGQKLLEGEAGRAGRFYRSCRNVTRIAELGAAPLRPLLTRIGGVTAAAGLVPVVAGLCPPASVEAGAVDARSCR